MRRLLKRLLGSLVYRSGLHRRLLRDRAVVVAFHRVNDGRPGNPIGCTPADFRAYCDFFRRYFIVVPLGELLRKLRRREDISGHLVITFDDGYKDNCTVAAVELSRRGLPACFFVVTDFIGSTHIPWWDQETAHTSEWMTWDDVRDLQAQGFEIGAHTKHHVDLGQLTGDAASEEIRGSRERIASELGAPTPFFSYPYGRADQMTDGNRELVKQAGFECCLSAFGGIITPGTNPFYGRREPISEWYLSPFQFGFEILFTAE